MCKAISADNLDVFTMPIALIDVKSNNIVNAGYNNIVQLSVLYQCIQSHMFVNMRLSSRNDHTMDAW